MNLGTIFDQLEQRLTALFLRLIDFLPDLVAALLVMLLGWILARLLRAVVRRASTSLLTQITRLHLITRGPTTGLLNRSAPRVMSDVTFWVVLVVFTAVAVEQLRIEVIADLFTRLTQYLPDLVLAVAIVLAGVVFGGMARQGIESTARTAAIGNAVALGRLGQAGVITAGSLVAADQIGVESTLLIVAFAITVGSALGGIALAFGVGSGPMVSNLIAARNVRKIYQTGQSVRIGPVEGRILEISSTMISIDTSDGTVQVPASKFGEETSVLLRER
jgi:hypothetical protein